MQYLVTQADSLLFQLMHIGGMNTWSDSELFAHADAETVKALLDTAVQFAGEQLLPLAASGDVHGCRLNNKRVLLPEGSVEVFRQWVALGFPAPGLSPDIDGLGLPLAVQCAAQELSDGANMSM